MCGTAFMYVLCQDDTLLDSESTQMLSQKGTLIDSKGEGGQDEHSPKSPRTHGKLDSFILQMQNISAIPHSALHGGFLPYPPPQSPSSESLP